VHEPRVASMAAEQIRENPRLARDGRASRRVVGQARVRRHRFIEAA
jgi:hypothetical protein